MLSGPAVYQFLAQNNGEVEHSIFLQHFKPYIRTAEDGQFFMKLVNEYASVISKPHPSKPGGKLKTVRLKELGTLQRQKPAPTSQAVQSHGRREPPRPNSGQSRTHERRAPPSAPQQPPRRDPRGPQLDARPVSQLGKVVHGGDGRRRDGSSPYRSGSREDGRENVLQPSRNPPPYPSGVQQRGYPSNAPPARPSTARSQDAHHQQHHPRSPQSQTRHVSQAPHQQQNLHAQSHHGAAQQNQQYAGGNQQQSKSPQRHPHRQEHSQGGVSASSRAGQSRQQTQQNVYAPPQVAGFSSSTPERRDVRAGSVASSGSAQYSQGAGQRGSVAQSVHSQIIPNPQLPRRPPPSPQRTQVLSPANNKHQSNETTQVHRRHGHPSAASSLASSHTVVVPDSSELTLGHRGTLKAPSSQPTQQTSTPFKAPHAPPPLRDNKARSAYDSKLGIGGNGQLGGRLMSSNAGSRAMSGQQKLPHHALKNIKAVQNSETSTISNESRYELDTHERQWIKAILDKSASSKSKINEIYNSRDNRVDKRKLAIWCDPINGYNILHYAAAKGDMAMMRLALEQFGVPVNSQSKSTGDTALHLAVKSSHFDLVEHLIRTCRAQHGIRNNAGETPNDVLKARCRLQYLVRTNDDWLDIKKLLRQGSPAVTGMQHRRFH